MFLVLERKHVAEATVSTFKCQKVAIHLYVTRLVLQLAIASGHKISTFHVAFH